MPSCAKRVQLLVIVIIIVVAVVHLTFFRLPRDDSAANTILDDERRTISDDENHSAFNATVSHHGSSAMADSAAEKPSEVMAQGLQTASTVTSSYSCPLSESNDSSRIPRQVFLIWKTQQLPSKAIFFDERWRQKEPDIPRCIFTDDECRQLASRYPDLQPHFDELPIAVMKGDVCRLLVAYYFGGVYMDLDVSGNADLDLIVNFHSSLPEFGIEVNSVLCNWFFATPPQHPFIKKVLDDIIEIISDPDRSYLRLHEFVLHTTGPYVWTKSLRQSGLKPKWTKPGILVNGIITHHFASSYANWNAIPNYTSWRAELAAHVRKSRTKAMTQEVVCGILLRGIADDNSNEYDRRCLSWRSFGQESWKTTKFADYSCHTLLSSIQIVSVNAWLNYISWPHRREICAFAKLFEAAGVYAHPRASPAAPFSSFRLNYTGPLQVGFGDANNATIATWFFASRANDPCLLLVLRAIDVALLQSVTAATANSPNMSHADFSISQIMTKVVASECIPLGIARVVWSYDELTTSLLKFDVELYKAELAALPPTKAAAKVTAFTFANIEERQRFAAESMKTWKGRKETGMWIFELFDEAQCHEIARKNVFDAGLMSPPISWEQFLRLPWAIQREICVFAMFSQKGIYGVYFHPRVSVVSKIPIVSWLRMADWRRVEDGFQIVSAIGQSVLQLVPQEFDDKLSVTLLGDDPPRSALIVASTPHHQCAAAALTITLKRCASSPTDGNFQFIFSAGDLPHSCYTQS